MENQKKYFALFVTEHLYYLPQYLPIAKELKKRNLSLVFLLTGDDNPAQIQIAKEYLHSQSYEYLDYSETKTQLECKHMICGAHHFVRIPVNFEYSSFVVHGIGTKAGNFTPEQNKYDIRFVEGSFRVELLKRLYPNLKTRLYDVGFAKLDTAINSTKEEKNQLFKKYKLDVTKKTILYAPTFYPSSIENMPIKFPENFKEYNLIIKPHFFSYVNPTYKHQMRKFKKWETYSNVFFADVSDFDLTPFMTIADLMITDESSAIFEFAALDKPVICNRHVRYRWSYRLFKWKIKKRMESSMDAYRAVATNLFHYNELLKLVKIELLNPQLNHNSRRELCEQVVGKVDGKVGERIVDVLQSF